MPKYNEGERVGPKEVLFIERVSDKRKGSYGLFECYTCKQPFKARLDHIVTGVTYNCSNCRGLKYKGKNNPNFVDLTGRRIGKLTVIEYLNKSSERNRSLWLCKCDCGKEVELPSEFITRKVKMSCGYCNFHSNGEYQISQCLEKLNIKYNTQYIFKDCKDIRPLPFDFYIPEYNVCIEYDGTSHYKANPFGSWNTPENVEKTQAHDKIKTEYCIQNNIPLIRIPYWDLDKINESYILDLLKISKRKDK